MRSSAAPRAGFKNIAFLAFRDRGGPRASPAQGGPALRPARRRHAFAACRARPVWRRFRSFGESHGLGPRRGPSKTWHVGRARSNVRIGVRSVGSAARCHDLPKFDRRRTASLLATASFARSAVRAARRPVAYGDPSPVAAPARSVLRRCGGRTRVPERGVDLTSQMKCRIPCLRERATVDCRQGRRKDADLELLRHHGTMMPPRCDPALVATLPT